MSVLYNFFYLQYIINIDSVYTIIIGTTVENKSELRQVDATPLCFSCLSTYIYSL